MNGQRPPLFTPALIGGAVAGLLSAIPFLNCLCCLWILGGAALAARLWAKDSPVPLTPGDGALVGAFSGLVAAVIDSLVSIPFAAMNASLFKRFFERLAAYTDQMPAGWEQWFDRGIGPFSIPMFFLGLVITSVIFAVFGALGGVIGISIFGKKSAGGAVPPAEPPTLPPQVS